jgi:hypothetical protein
MRASTRQLSGALTHACVLFLLVALLLLPSLARAQCPQPSQGVTPLEEETLAVTSTAVGLTPAKYQPAGSTASMAMIQVKTASITYRLKGTPVPGDGTDVSAGASFAICGIDSIRAIRLISSGTASLFVTYYKGRSP